MHASFMLKDRSNRELLAGIKNLIGQECNTTAYIIAHLSEIEIRKLHMEEGCPSLFKYCTDVLHLSESAAYRRIDVARIAGKCPVIFEMLADGSVNLTTVLILGPCLTEENHQELLAAAKHRSKEEVERLAVAVRPRPDVPSVIRKLPGLDTTTEGSLPGVLELGGLGAGVEVAPLPVAEASPQQESAGEVAALPVRSVPSPRPVVSPLSPERYKIQFTASTETCRKLRQLQELLRHQVPNGDLATIIDRGLTLLLEQVTREKLAQVKHPRKPASRAGGRTGRVEPGATGSASATVSLDAGDQARFASRHIPADVKREVWRRDEGQCAFVSKTGRRCSERGRIEFHHVEPYALGGPATIENIALRCRAHNAHEGELVFGARANGGRGNGSWVGLMGERQVASGAERNELALERVSRKTSTTNARLS